MPLNILKIFVILIFFSLASTAKAQEKATLYQAFTPDGINPTTPGYISILDPLNFNELTQIPLPLTKPERLILSKNKDLIFVVNDPIIAPRRGIVVVSLSEQQIVRTLFDGVSVYGAKQAPDGTIWFLLDQTKQIAVVDPVTFAIKEMLTYDEAPRDVIFSPDGERAYISFLNTDVLIIGVKLKNTIANIRNLPKRNDFQVRPQELELSPDGRTLYVGSRNNLSIVELPSLRI